MIENIEAVIKVCTTVKLNNNLLESIVGLPPALEVVGCSAGCETEAQRKRRGRGREGERRAEEGQAWHDLTEGSRARRMSRKSTRRIRGVWSRPTGKPRTNEFTARCCATKCLGPKLRTLHM